jgi:hypothetical protein
MLFNTINELENKLEKFSNDNLKSMLCIHSDVSNKPDFTVDDLSTSTSHAFDSKLNSIDIKPVIEDTAILDNSYLTNHVMPKSKLLVFALAAFCWTKSLLCNVADFTRMPYQFRIFKYSKFISLI